MICPICARPSDADARPFCSRRCADIDLAKWLTGAYAIASDEPVDEDADIDAISPERRH